MDKATINSIYITVYLYYVGAVVYYCFDLALILLLILLEI